jgi:hypothetical protein
MNLLLFSLISLSLSLSFHSFPSPAALPAVFCPPPSEVFNGVTGRVLREGLEL